MTGGATTTVEIDTTEPTNSSNTWSAAAFDNGANVDLVMNFNEDLSSVNKVVIHLEDNSGAAQNFNTTTSSTLTYNSASSVTAQQWKITIPSTEFFASAGAQTNWVMRWQVEEFTDLAGNQLTGGTKQTGAATITHN